MLLEHRKTAREELPGLDQLGPTIDRVESVAPARDGPADDPRELLSSLGRDDLRARLPDALRRLVASAEPGPEFRRRARVPPACLADRAPLTHARDVRHDVVQV